LAEYCGYDQTELVRLHPYPDEARVSGSDPLTERVNGHLCGPQDIALVARTPAAAPAADEEVVTA
jgi:O-antigen chain-terminating methyltransferase